MRTTWKSLLCLLLLTATLVACGKKAPPTPITEDQPAQTDEGR